MDASEGDPEFMWIGVSCTRDTTGEPVPMLQIELARQMETHARALLLRRERSRGRLAAFKTAARAIGGLLGIEAIERVLELKGHYDDLRTIEEELRRGADDRAPRILPGESSVDSATLQRFLDVLSLLDEEEVPLVLVVDDAHDSDATTTALVRALFDVRARVLVVATGWPTALRAQRESAGGFGLMIAELENDPRVVVSRVGAVGDDDMAAMALELFDVTTAERPSDDAAFVARRAHGNPLHLRFLASVACANELVLGAATRDDLAQLKSDFDDALRDVWLRYLPADVRALLVATSALGTPVVLRQIAAAANKLPDELANASATLESAARYGWLVGDRDVDGDDVFVRFADPMFEEAARERSELVLDRRRAAACSAAVWATVFPPVDVHTSSRGFAVSHDVARRICAERLADRKTCALLGPLVLAGVARSLAWRGDMTAAARVYRRAAELAALVPGHPETDTLIGEASERSFAAGDPIGSVEVFDIGGDRLLGYKAIALGRAERIEEALAVGIDALRAELTSPGTLAGRIGSADAGTFFEADDETEQLVHTADEAAGALVVGYQDERRTELSTLITDLAVARHHMGDRRSAEDLLRIGVASEVLSADDAARVADETGLAVPDVEAEDTERLARYDDTAWAMTSAAELSEDSPESLRRASDRVDAMVVQGNPAGALPLARALAAADAQNLATLAWTESAAGEHPAAVEHWRELRDRARREAAADTYDVYNAWHHVVLELVALERHDEAMAEVVALLELARRAGSPPLELRALYAHAKVLEAIGDVETARSALTQARERTSPGTHWQQLVDLARCRLEAADGDWNTVQSIEERWREFRPVNSTTSRRLRAWGRVAAWHVDPASARRDWLAAAELEDLDTKDRELADRGVTALFAAFEERLLDNPDWIPPWLAGERVHALALSWALETRGRRSDALALQVICAERRQTTLGSRVTEGGLDLDEAIEAATHDIEMLVTLGADREAITRSVAEHWAPLVGGRDAAKALLHNASRG